METLLIVVAMIICTRAINVATHNASIAIIREIRKKEQ